MYIQRAMKVIACGQLALDENHNDYTQNCIY